MSQLSILQIAKMQEKEREETMSKLFQQLLGMKDEDKIKTLKDLIREMAEKATD
ncbi:MAG: hypothetical protein OWQ50_00305 [Acidianus infernus]|nr:hypothetical protein [Acidianus infernus]